MKKAIVLAALSLMTTQSFAATIMSAKLDAAKKNILIDVSYGGGCQTHEFRLEVGGCLESLPVQCTAQLIETSPPDFCEAFIHTTVVISLKEAGLTGSYYKGASLTILGDKDWETKKASTADIRLP